MKCLNCGNEMQQGIVEGYGQGGHSCYEFTSDEEKKKKCRLCFIQGSSRIYDYFHAVGLWK